jgi:shikimate kinase/3-dehydroquinate synthase
VAPQPGGSGRRSIAFIGFMAAGKTRAARAAARELGERRLDTDELLVERLGEPIEAFFAREGEAAFRAVEEEVVLEALGRGAVVALGGGALASARVREELARHVTVWCRVREELAWARSRESGRPLAVDRARFAELFAEREPVYAAAATVVLPRGGDDSPALAAHWLNALRATPPGELKLAWARTASAEYPVFVGPGAGRVLSLEGAPRVGARLFAVADPAAVAGAGEIPAGAEQPAFEARGGESSKTLAEAERLLGELAERGVRRDDAIAAVGGGVVGDLAGFCAAVYQRGIPVVQVPTTVVAQVDSAIGGKTGVDMPAAKNYVGAYHQPAAVLADPGALASLPREELAAGFAEVVKTALIAGGDLWERVRAMRDPGPGELASVVFDCAATKIGVVAEDERDGGRRAVLNLGHTVGHAIETATAYSRYRHGEAVALGLLAALRLSEADELRAEVAELLASAGLPTSLDPGLDAEEIVEATGRDKKRDAAGLGFVLVRAPGEVEHGQPVGDAELRVAVGELAP